MVVHSIDFAEMNYRENVNVNNIEHTYVNGWKEERCIKLSFKRIGLQLSLRVLPGIQSAIAISLFVY